MAHRRTNELLQWRWAIIVAALAAAALLAAPGLARAEGLLDFLFGGLQQRQRPPADVNSYAEPSPGIGRVAPPPMGPESVRQSDGGGGRGVAYCVRLCDGQHFPMEHLANATPIETCRAMCPASKTKVFFGNNISRAAASDGARYADLDTAFVYQKQLVANCTCNGKDAFGLAHFDLSSDPTLRPGDIVSTKDGYVAFSGRRGQADAFTPIDASAVAAQLSAAPSRQRLSRSAEAPPADDEPGAIVRPPPQPVVDLSGQPR